MKKQLTVILIFLKWVVYYFITTKERHLYSMGKHKGMACIDSRDDSRILYGSARVYSYIPGQAPERNYLTWREFWTRYGYYKKDSKSKEVIMPVDYQRTTINVN